MWHNEACFKDYDDITEVGYILKEYYGQRKKINFMLCDSVRI